MNDLYDRQKSLSLSLPEHAVIIGVGGTGSWLALFLALAGVESITMYDPDEVEPHNLNRTPFTWAHVGRKKVHAMAEIVATYRPDCTVSPIPRAVYLPLPNLKDGTIVVDCRDSMREHVGAHVRTGYDGVSDITVHINPSDTNRVVFATTRDASGYTTPSWVGGAVGAALFGLHAVLLATQNSEEPKETILSLDLQALLKKQKGE